MITWKTTMTIGSCPDWYSCSPKLAVVMKTPTTNDAKLAVTKHRVTVRRLRCCGRSVPVAAGDTESTDTRSDALMADCERSLTLASSCHPKSHLRHERQQPNINISPD